MLFLTLQLFKQGKKTAQNSKLALHFNFFKTFLDMYDVNADIAKDHL